MKGGDKLKKLLALAALIILILTTTTAFAQDREHVIAEYIFNIQINQDGSAYIEERITNRFTGSFNGVFLNIDQRRFGSVEDYSVYEYIPATGQLIPFEMVRRASNGDDGVFTSRRDEGIRRFQVFSPSTDEYRTFVFRYNLTQATTRFTDYGQFHRTLIGQWDVPIESYQVNITFQSSSSRGNISAQALIDGNPTWDFITGDHISFESYTNILRPGQTLGISTTFPREWIPYARSTNRSVHDAPFPWGRVLLGTAGAIFLLVIAIIVIKAWPHKVDFQDRYYEKLPADNGPALMAYLWRERQLKIKDVLATLLNLARKGIVTITTAENDTAFTIKNNHNQPLQPHEQYVLTWLFEDLASSDTITLADINEAGKTEESALLFHENFNHWATIVATDAEPHNYYESYWRRTPHGELEYQKWRAFKRYLKTFTEVQRVHINTHDFWQNYLPYALSLGSAKKLMAKLPSIPMPASLDPWDTTNIMWFTILSPQLLGACNSAFTNTFSLGYGYASANDSSSGGGASFSSGGGGSSGGAF